MGIHLTAQINMARLLGGGQFWVAGPEGAGREKASLNSSWIYTGRIAGGDRDHRNTDRDVVAVGHGGEAACATDRLSVESAANGRGDGDV